MNLMVDSPNIAQDLFPNLYTFISHLIATAIILFFLIFFVWKPFKKFLKNRNKYIADNISTSEKQRELSEHDREEQAKVLTDAKIKAVQIVEESKQQAYFSSDAIIAKAKVQSQRMINEAKANIITERVKNEKDIRQEIVNSAVLMAEKFLEREISREDNQHLIDNFLNELAKDE